MNLRNLRIPPTVTHGSIQALDVPATIAGSFSLTAIVNNRSGHFWESSKPNLVHVSYHWLDEDWNMVVFDGKRTQLPAGGIPPSSSTHLEVHIDPPPSPGHHHLCLTLVQEGIGWFEADEAFQPHLFAVEFVALHLPASSSAPNQPVIICAYLHDTDVPKVRKAFGLDEKRGGKLDFFFWKDTEQLGPEKAFQYSWKQFPDRDVIIIHPDMAPLPDDVDNSWYEALLKHVADLPEAGIIGCDLLFAALQASGTYGVQCAGGTFENGTISHIAGRNLEYSQNLRRPREVAWATFGGVYIRRSTIEACGDLDPDYQWAYVGDVDYCFEARRRGIKVYQVPVNLLHAENGTTAPFLQKEEFRVKAAANMEHFHKKWQTSALYRQQNPSSLDKKPELFLVLGMHRSGTSLTTRLLKCLGTSVSPRLVDNMPDNPRGFFEDRDVYGFHENKLLPALGVTWDSVRAPEWSALNLAAAAELQKEALHILQRNYHRDQSAWIIKDPRLMILLPFWRPLLDRMFARTNIVLALRDPKEVVASLHRRNGMSRKHGDDLFTHYWLSALAGLSLEASACVNFAAVVSNPGKALKDVAEHYGYEFNDEISAEVEVFRREFFDPSLVHTTTDSDCETSASLSDVLYNTISSGRNCPSLRLPRAITQALRHYQLQSQKAAKVFTQLAEELARQMPTLR